jgi:hypothetical protein
MTEPARRRESSAEREDIGVSGRTILATAAAVMLSAGLMLSGGTAAAAPKCGKLCKSVISSCKAGCNEITSKKDKRKCKKTCRSSALSRCKQTPKDARTCPASPSGAFLD